jgi:glycosyltransferase involved in cell wall biosynthesis
LALPNKLFEYLQAGLPVVVSSSDERDALLKRYAIGESFAPGNSKALAAAINTVLACAAANAYSKPLQTAAKELSWENERERLLNVYRSVLPV